jgi:LDH2 family malate/lactate/ureidoglycolate dehydrogenase
MSITEATKPKTAQGPSYAAVDDALAFGRRLLVAHGLSEADAAIMAGCMVCADLRGVDTHGLQFLPQYLDRVRRGLVNPKPNLVVKQITPMIGSLDGENGYGFVVATKAMAAAIDMAKEYGIGIVSARRSTHFGMAACYTLQALDAGMISFVFTNASRAMPAWGGREGLLGTSPFAAAAPSGMELPFDLDMSPAVAARGKIRRAARRGQKIPLGYALDAKGQATTDPNAALDGGVVLPIGGAKGSGIAMLMDIMGGVISGAAFGGDVRNQFLDYDEPQNVGHFFMAMKPDLFVPKNEYLKRMDRLVQRVHAQPAAEDFDEVIMPGETERRLEASRRRTGLPYHAKEVAALQKEAAKVGLPALPVSNAPLG